MARKTGQRQAPSGSGGEGGPPRHIDKTDNMTEADKRKALDEADQVQLLSGLSQLKPLIARADVLKAELKEAQDAVTNKKKGLSGALRCDVKVINEILEDQGAVRKDVSAKETMRARIRRFAAQPVGDSEEQQELLSRMPDFERDIFYWRGAGYAAGLRGDDRMPPKDCPGDQAVLSAYDEEWVKGMSQNALLLGGQKARQEAAAAPAPKEETEIERRRREKKEEKEAKAKLDALPAAPDDDQGTGDMAAGVIHEPGTNGDDDGFEATEEELAAQAGRRQSDEDEDVVV